MGTHPATLTVIDDDGASESTTLIIQVYCQIGAPYSVDDGLTVTLNDLNVTEQTSSYEYEMNYTLLNDTSDQIIDEGKFRMYYANDSGGLLQEGSFGELGPGDTMTKTYTFVEEKSKPFDILEYSANNSFAPEPASDSLKWLVEIP